MKYELDVMQVLLWARFDFNTRSFLGNSKTKFHAYTGQKFFGFAIQDYSCV